MKILFIEDDNDKVSAISNFVEDRYPQAELTVRQSLQSGLEELVSKTFYDAVFLDMTLPNYDISPSEPDGGSPESFAGRDILRQLKLRRISADVYIITQFDTFGENAMTLTELKEELEKDFSENYRGTISFKITSNEWEKELSRCLENLT